MPSAAETISDAVVASFRAATPGKVPYRHFFLEDCVPADKVREIQDLPFEAPSLDGLSGKRELHNATRVYFDTENQTRYPVCRDVADAFQGRSLTGFLQDHLGIDLAGSYLRIEFAQDVEGFWLEPHTDLGVKLFTMLLYVSEGPGHEGLGTDIYDADRTHVARSPFSPGAAMVFVPSDVTYHGFEQRPIDGVRKSVIINYVTDDWRAREQLAFPHQPVS